MAKRVRPKPVKVRLGILERYAKANDALMATLLVELRPIAQLFERFEAKLKRHEELVKKASLTNEQAEQTLMNCLLAIRQTEALQAWYPAQRGFRETKVSGPHPMWIDEKAKEKAQREHERQLVDTAVPEGEDG